MGIWIFQSHGRGNHFAWVFLVFRGVHGHGKLIFSFPAVGSPKIDIFQSLEGCTPVGRWIFSFPRRGFHWACNFLISRGVHNHGGWNFPNPRLWGVSRLIFLLWVVRPTTVGHKPMSWVSFFCCFLDLGLSFGSLFDGFLVILLAWHLAISTLVSVTHGRGLL